MTQEKRKIILFANGELFGGRDLIGQISKNDYLIAVDGGLNHMITLGLQPDLIIGDLDSIDKATLNHHKKQQVKIEQYPIQKDQNDLELAIQAALKMAPQVIWIVAALGNRIDQTLANIFLLTRADLADIDVHLVDGQRDVFLIRQHTTLTGLKGQRVSLIPINGPVNGIRTEGLAYPLKCESLYPHQTRGISNYLTDAKATITIEHGLLLCVHSKSKSEERNG